MNDDKDFIILDTTEEDRNFSTPTSDVINQHCLDFDVDAEEYDPYYGNNYLDDEDNIDGDDEDVGDDGDDDDVLVINISDDEVNIFSLMNNFSIFYSYIYFYFMGFRTNGLHPR